MLISDWSSDVCSSDLLLPGGRGAVGRLPEVERGEQCLEPLAVLGEVDGVGRGAEAGDPGALEIVGQLQRRLAAELHDATLQNAAALLLAPNADHVLGGQLLEVEAVRGFVLRCQVRKSEV